MMEPQSEDALGAGTDVPPTTQPTTASVDLLTSLVDSSLTVNSSLPAPSAIPNFGLNSSAAPVNLPASPLIPVTGSLAQPVLAPPSLPPLIQQGGVSPLPTPTPLPTGMASAGPPKAGFQPVPHGLKSYESHHSAAAATSQSYPAAPAAPPMAGVNIFTPAPADPNTTPLSPYAASQPQSYGQPVSQPANGGHSAVQLSMGDYPETAGQHVHRQTSGSDVGIIDWIKSNETVNMVMHKAKTGVQTVITAMDPQMRDVLYSGGDISIAVASAQQVKVNPCKLAFQDTFGRATVFGVDSQPNMAPQPVGYTSGIRGAEERITNLRRSGNVTPQQVCLAVESFIADLQPGKWYDIACLILDDPVNHITLQTFSQATPVNLEYVTQAQNETSADYSLAWSGLAVTVGQLMHRQCAVDPSDWHFYFSGVSRADGLLLAARQLAYMYKQRLPRC